MNSDDRLIFANHCADNLSNENSLGKLYHINSKLSTLLTEENIIKASPLVMDKEFRKLTNAPEKSYPGKELFKLEEPELNCSLQEVLTNRRSHNKEAIRRNLTLKELSSITWAGYGISENSLQRRTAPSAGALYPCELYLLSIDTALGDGLFHYSPQRNCYELLKREPIELNKLFVSTIGIEQASAVFLVSAVFNRAYFKYGERAYRFILLEAGEITQNISLAATGFGRVATSHGGTADVELEKYLDLDGISESILIAVGIT